MCAELSLFAKEETADRSSDQRSGLNFLALSQTETEPTILQGLKNELSVVSGTLSQTPGEFAAKLSEDFSENGLATAQKLIGSLAFGVGTGVLLSRSPVLTKAGLGALGIYGAYEIGSYNLGLLKSAWSASSDLERRQLINMHSKIIGTQAANLFETAPALVGGFAAGSMLTGRSSVLENLALNVRTKVDFPVRKIVPESMHYLGFDSHRLKVAAADGSIDLFRASDEMAKLTPWRGVEEARLFKLGRDGNLKLSEALPGTARETVLGRRSVNTFHTHERSVLPTSSDYHSTKGIGIISTPSQNTLTFFEGTGLQADRLLSLVKSGDRAAASALETSLHKSPYVSVLVNREAEAAVRITKIWNPQKGFEISSLEPLNFGQVSSILAKRQPGQGLGLNALAAEPFSAQTTLKIRPLVKALVDH